MFAILLREAVENSEKVENNLSYPIKCANPAKLFRQKNNGISRASINKEIILFESSFENPNPNLPNTEQDESEFPT